MNILKFGGSSVGTAEALLNVRNILDQRKEDKIVVVSALSGITDKLIGVATMAEAGDRAWKESYSGICARHRSVMDELFGGKAGKESLEKDVNEMLGELGRLLEAVQTLRVIPDMTRNEIVSFGERLSSRIVNELIDGSVLYDSRQFIKTVEVSGKTILDSVLTPKLVREAFARHRGTAIVPGFISTSSSDGSATTLGRGGSDYTASIIAAALDADCLEIWTDVDGFMTADPRIIKTSYVIEELSFEEAMELCNFGAKVVYAPALYPVKPKGIPVLIKNSFNPGAKGSVIKGGIDREGRTVTGIASISDISLLTLSGPSMAGLIGIDSRLFGALKVKGISVFLVSQSSSETGITIGVEEKEAENARKAVDEEFAEEIARGAMNPVGVSGDLAAIAVVGENMKHSRGVAGKLFSTLGRNGIGVLACAQGSSDYNISIVVERKFLRKALNVIHDSFFLSEYQELNLFICGTGNVGGELIEQISKQREKLMKEHNLKLNIVGISRSTKGIFTRDGIDPAAWKERLADAKPMGLQEMKDEVIGMNIFNSVFVDCTASEEVAGLYNDFFEHGISVVTANKVAASSEYSNYSKLKSTAFKRGVKYLFETNVGAGLPIINTINALRNSGDRVEKIEAVLSGTLNFIFNTISADIPFSETVRMAKEQGYAEPDPRIDLSGKDVIRKLVILAREAGNKVEQEDVDAGLFIPRELFECSLGEFWAKLPSVDARFEEERKRLERERKRWKFVAKMEDGKYSVSLQEVEEGHPFYKLEGSNNIILITTERYHKHPMCIQGYGAGAEVTAAGVFADIISIANI